MSRQRLCVCLLLMLLLLATLFGVPSHVLAQSLTPTPTNTPTLPPSSTPTPTTTITATTVSTATITNTPTITLTPTPFPPPTLVSPNDGATVFETQPTLQWSLVNGSVFYSVQVSQTNTFAMVINNGTTTNTQYTVSAPLAAGTYYWRVGSWSGVQMVYSAPRVMILVTPTPSHTPTPTLTGTPNPTQTSVAATLTALAYTATPFPAPVLVSPSESASLPGAAISFVWGSVAGSSWYKIEVASELSFTSYAINAWVSSPTTTYNSPSPLPIGLYYWRAGSWDGTTITYSAPRSLTITANETATVAWQRTATVAALTATYTPSPTTTPTPTQTPSLTPTLNTQATQAAAIINTSVVGTLTPVALGGDVFENDDTPDAAKQIVIGESQQRTFYKLGAKDIDWAWVNLKPGLWRISARTDAGQLDPKLTMIWQGKEIAKGDDEDGKNAVVLVQVTSQGRYDLKVENLGVDVPNQFYSLIVEKVEIKAANVVPTARPPTARPSVKVTVRIFVDRNGDGTMGADEGVNQVLVVVSAGASWNEQANTLNGLASFVIPSTIKEGTDVIVAAPYLHRTAKFKLPNSGDVVSDVALPAPVLPVFIP